MNKALVRWDGPTKSTSEYNGLEKDPDLWTESGDTLVYLDALDQSINGPSFRIRHSDLASSGYGSVLSTVATEYVDYEWNEMSGECSVRNVFIPIPNELDENKTAVWHITTRNFFAFCLGLPLIGYGLSEALVSLHERILNWTGQDAKEVMSRYLEKSGYQDLTHAPVHALSLLAYAERLQLESLWKTAFAHCVGMADVLPSAPEYEVSETTKQAISNAATALSGRVEYACHAMSTFLEEDMSPAYIGLTVEDRGQLEKFQSFLATFYSKRFGPWPARSLHIFPKSFLLSMYRDFEKVYDFMVDPESTNSLRDQRPASGGICVLQNLQAFDERHGFKTMKTPLPLFPLPQPAPLKRRMSMARPLSRSSSMILDLSALAETLKDAERSAHSSAVVQAYRQFEEDLIRSENDYSVFCDGRKVRWIMVYEGLQILKSIIHQTPKGDVSSEPTYIVFWDGSVSFPWTSRNQHATLKPRYTPIPHDLMAEPSEKIEPRPASEPPAQIFPDCERDTGIINYVEVDTKRQSWFETLLLREPSSQALKDLQKQIAVSKVKTKSVKERSKERSFSLDLSQLSGVSSVVKRMGSLKRMPSRRFIFQSSSLKGKPKRDCSTSQSAPAGSLASDMEIPMVPPVSLTARPNTAKHIPILIHPSNMSL